MDLAHSHGLKDPHDSELIDQLSAERSQTYLFLELVLTLATNLEYIAISIESDDSRDYPQHHLLGGRLVYDCRPKLFSHIHNMMLRSDSGMGDQNFLHNKIFSMLLRAAAPTL